APDRQRRSPGRRGVSEDPLDRGSWGPRYLGFPVPVTASRPRPLRALLQLRWALPGRHAHEPDRQMRAIQRLRGRLREKGIGEKAADSVSSGWKSRIDRRFSLTLTIFLLLFATLVP